MTRDEVVDLIGTIAQSGTAELLASSTGARPAGAGAAELIGQFGVGFYSAFMVADQVSWSPARPAAPTAPAGSPTGEGTYTIDDVDDAPQGTTVTLHLKPEDTEDELHDYTDRRRPRIVKRYSDFITWPIRMAPTTATDVRRRGRRRARDRQLHQGAVGPAAERGLRGGVHRVLPARQPRLDRTAGDHPACRPRAPSSTRRCCSSRRHAPIDLYMRDASRGVQLYVKRVFIMDDCEALMPDYLRFVKGVVDAGDLSLNISREILQQDRQIRLIRQRLVKKVLATVKTMRDDEPEKYATFWSPSSAGRSRRACWPTRTTARPSCRSARSPPQTTRRSRRRWGTMWLLRTASANEVSHSTLGRRTTYLFVSEAK